MKIDISNKNFDVRPCKCIREKDNNFLDERVLGVFEDFY